MKFRFKVGDRITFKKGGWLDHDYIDNCKGTIRGFIKGDYIIEWVLPTSGTVDDIFKLRHEDFLHYDKQRIRNDKLKELGL
jgi:hypothetical protein